MQGKNLKFATKLYLEQAEELNLRPATKKNRRNCLRRLVRFLGGKPFSLDATKSYMKHLRESGWQASSIRNETKQLRAFTHFLYRQKLVPEDFSKELPIMRVYQKEPDPPAREVLEKIIIAGTQIKKGQERFRECWEDARVALRFALHTGLRANEICQLRGRDLHLETDPPFFIVEGKGGDRKSLPVPPDPGLIRELRKRVNREKAFSVTWWILSLTLRRGAKKLGIKERVHVHSLRHSYCTHLLKNKIPLAKVKRLMRHSSFRYLDIYTHFQISDLAEELKRLYIPKLSTSEAFEQYVKILEEAGANKDKRFEFTVDRTNKILIIKVEQKT